jgi:hypothetical protein
LLSIWSADINLLVQIRLAHNNWNLLIILITRSYLYTWCVIITWLLISANMTDWHKLVATDNDWLACIDFHRCNWLKFIDVRRYDWLTCIDFCRYDWLTCIDVRIQLVEIYWCSQIRLVDMYWFPQIRLGNMY